MPLESASFINGLDANNPAGGDSLSQADEHIRLIKSSVKATFPNITAAVTATHTQLNQLTTVDFASYVTLSGVQTLTNKTLTNPVLNTPTLTGSANFGILTGTTVNTVNGYMGVLASNKINLTTAGGNPHGIDIDNGNQVFGIRWMSGTTQRGNIGGNSSYPFYVGNSASTAVFYLDQSGNTVAAGNISAYSDVRLKDNVETLENALDVIEKLRGVSYVRKDSGDRRVGLIAQEVREVLPEAVLGSEDEAELGMYLSVSYGDLVGVLVEAVKDLSAKVRELEARV